MAFSPIKHISVIKVRDGETIDKLDVLAIEEPLEIRLEYGTKDNRQMRNISVTMRTPGNDTELAAGFLFTEGIIKNCKDIADISHCFIACAENKENVIQVSLNETTVPHLQNTDRNFYTTSSCGVCGKGSINAIRTVGTFVQQEDNTRINAEVLYQLPDVLRQHQKVFEDTGGLHASALFTTTGKLLLVREDVGRHNALDKLIGAAMISRHPEFISGSQTASDQHDVNHKDELLKQVQQGNLSLSQHVLMLSGRASFELVQKAAMASINIIAAVGAPSSLAVQLAEEFNITLIGFLRYKRFNIYTAVHRVLIPEYEITH